MLNVDLKPYADIIVDSLTKYVAGNAMVMGGAAVVSPQSPWANELITHLQETDDEACGADDIQLLADCARGYPQRIARINDNAQDIVARLRATLRWTTCSFQIPARIMPSYGAMTAAYGGLCSIVLKQPRILDPGRL